VSVKDHTGHYVITLDDASLRL